MNKELNHHGVEGQKWGVRHGPPYPIEDKKLPKGTKLNSVSGIGNAKAYRKSGKWMYTYNPDDEWDSAVYKGPFSKYLRLYRGNMFVYEHRYQTTKDLMMPTKKERIDEFKNIMNSKRQNVYKKELKNIQEYSLSVPSLAPSRRKQLERLNVDNLKTEQDYKDAYVAFNILMEAQHNYFVTRDYSKSMSKKYDAMVDDNNQGGYNEAHDPIIIFKANKFLEEVKDTPTKRICDDEIIKNYDKVKAELEKKGKNVAL